MQSLLFRTSLVAFFLSGCGGDAAPPTSTSGEAVDEVDAVELHLQVVTFCGNCHACPSPDSFPRDAWFNEVQRGFKFYDESGREDLQRPRPVDVVDYYRARAPEKLPTAVTRFKPDSSLQFRKTQWHSKSAGDSPMISALTIRVSQADTTKKIIASDMRTGEIVEITPGLESCTARLIAKLKHPAKTVCCDLDRDGKEDLLVAELGSQLPSDNRVGEVVWIRSIDSEVPESPVVIAGRLGRVSDVVVLDADNDGDQDIVVSVFGWQKTGEILLLEHADSEGSPSAARFSTHVIDARHGTIQTGVYDMNGDGTQDLLALISQEHEQIVLFPGKSDGQFDIPRVVFDAGEPAFGSSSMGVVDIDNDGDPDSIYTNGDTLDSYYVKPYHGVHWMENEGTLPFQHHRLATFAGATCVVPGDFDGDGDCDLIASSFLPKILKTQIQQSSYPTLIWLEQQEGRFDSYLLETAEVGHMVILADDLDADGASDLIVGHYIDGSYSGTPSVSIWWNRRTKASPGERGVQVDLP